MRAAIYARTCKREKQHHTTSIANQVAFCRELASQHNLTVEPEHVFTDVELTGDLLPSCWADEGEPSRPALAGMVEAVQNGEIQRILVHSMENLGTSSAVLTGLLGLLDACDVRIVARRDQIEKNADPSARFAAGILMPRIQLDTEVDRVARELIRQKKRDEIARLEDRIARLQAEIAEL